ncbi:hypothetical protein [Candidatus Pantoea multigeneris]|uniref:Uncharacterized protein n=1 Tax=Candidatus Pantoea multigeneris TaxID=2608357 RepID=A0ABX0RF22_9GAMM|nr:hypothetical protein [Pantoea multigeneris]NIF23960.1 hypothetical protein [Pantoea multigeneris]
MSIISYLEKHTPSPAKIALILGGFILLYYSVVHSAMPDNLSLGDGIWLIFISAISGGIILMGVIFYAAMACCILDLIRRVVIRSVPSENEPQGMKNLRIIFKEYIPVFDTVIYLTPVLWVFICIMLFIRGKREWIFIISGSLLLWPVIIMLVLMMVKLYRNSIPFGFTPAKTERFAKNAQDLRSILLYFSFSVVLYSFLLGFISPVADTTMKILSVRQENVSLYVKSPWSDVLQRHLPVSSGCKVPQGYALFEHVTLSFSNLGNSVSVEIQGQKKATSLKIPGDSVIVDPAPLNPGIPDTGCVSDRTNKPQVKTL